MNPVKRSNRFVLNRVGRTYALPFSRASLNMGWLSVFDLHQTFSPNTFHPSQIQRWTKMFDRLVGNLSLF